MIPLIGGLSFWPKLIIGVVLAFLVGWGVRTVYSSIYDRGHARGVADTQQAERDCIEGSVCAEAVVTRAAAQQVVVDQAQAKAKAVADAAAAVLLEQEKAARADAETRAAAALAAANAAERRYQRALASNQACATWSAAEVPCPIE